MSLVASDRSRSDATLIDEFIAAQGDLTAVAQFSSWHETAPATRGHYRDLIPLSRPQAGQQYAFEVNQDLCSGCKACVTACHNLNGLDEGETWRSVGQLTSEQDPYQQAVTTACHHCVDPGCLTGCPVNAYDKDPVTGIVRHLDDQCIGCPYCVLKCPYEVPKFNSRLGIVRKCDMCSSRLSTGEAPACVQGCPNEAILIRIVEQDQVRSSLAFGENRFLNGTPDPRITFPTTVFTSTHTAGAAQQESPVAAAAHTPLVWMLVLTQLSVGGYASLAAFGRSLTSGEQDALITGSLTALMSGLLVSIFHLGRPHLAWRALLNLKRSWMSREILLFGIYMISAIASASCHSMTTFYGELRSRVHALDCVTAVLGMLAVFSSVMIYHDTRRSFWDWKATSQRFFGTVIVLGAAALPLITQTRAAMVASALILISVSAIKLRLELSLLFPALAFLVPAERATRLLRGPLRGVVVARFIFGILGGILVPLLLAKTTHEPTLAILAGIIFLGCFLGELLERLLFFTASAPDRVPGQFLA